MPPSSLNTATALRAIEEKGKENCRFLFADTGNEHELTYQYLYDYLQPRLNIRIETVKADFTQRIADKRTFIQTHWAAEGWVIRHPIVNWSAAEVINYITKTHQLQLNPLYRQGMHRVGCMPCINCRKDDMHQMATRYPEHIDKIRQWEHLVCLVNKRRVSSFFSDKAKRSTTPQPGYHYDKDSGHYVESAEAVYERIKIDERVKWAATGRGGHTYDLFKQHPPPACVSVYGLCE